MSTMQDLYQQVILDHSKQRRGHAAVPEDGWDGRASVDHGCAVAGSHQVNTLCGDEVRLTIRLEPADGSAIISALEWDGQGCSISQASLSAMSELVTGASVDHANALAADFRELMNSRGNGLDEDRMERLEDAAAFVGVSQFPMRIKCALLGWAALHDAILKSNDILMSQIVGGASPGDLVEED